MSDLKLTINDRPIDHDEVIVLPSGNELSLEAARGDLARAAKRLASLDDQDAQGLSADLDSIRELLTMPCDHDWQPGKSVTGRQHDGQVVTVDQSVCSKCGTEAWD